MLMRIHVNQHNIRKNNSSDSKLPVLTLKTYRDNQYANEIRINGPSIVVYRPDKPLPCGAKVWIETTAANVEVLR